MNRFDYYVKFDESAVKLQLRMKDQFLLLEKIINGAPDSRERALAYTRLEEAFMWATKAIRNEQYEKRKTEIAD